MAAWREENGRNLRRMDRGGARTKYEAKHEKYLLRYCFIKFLMN